VNSFHNKFLEREKGIVIEICRPWGEGESENANVLATEYWRLA
jgi:hypothetical protein